MMSPKQTVAVIIIMIACALVFNYVLRYFDDIKKGVIKLECLPADAILVTDPRVLESWLDGVWVFENGLARQCK